MTDDFDDIQKNSIYKIVFSQKMPEDDKPGAIADALAFDDKDKGRSGLAQLKAFQDYLQYERVKLAGEVRKLEPRQSVEELLPSLRNVNTGMSSLYAILDKGTAAAGNDAADQLVKGSPEGFEEYFRCLGKLIKDTRATYSEHSANSVRIKQISDLSRENKDVEARRRIASLIEAELSAANPAPPAFLFDAATTKPITVRGALRFKTPSM